MIVKKKYINFTSAYLLYFKIITLLSTQNDQYFSGILMFLWYIHAVVLILMGKLQTYAYMRYYKLMRIAETYNNFARMLSLLFS